MNIEYINNHIDFQMSRIMDERVAHDEALELIPPKKKRAKKETQADGEIAERENKEKWGANHRHDRYIGASR
jgi:hypothetical protein